MYDLNYFYRESWIQTMEFVFTCTWLIQPSAHQAASQNLAKRQCGQLILAGIWFTYVCVCVFWMWVSEMFVRVCMCVCIQQESRSDKSGTAYRGMACMVRHTHIENKELRKSGSLLVSRIQLRAVSFQFWVMPRLKMWRHITITGTCSELFSFKKIL